MTKLRFYLNYCRFNKVSNNSLSGTLRPPRTAVIGGASGPMTIIAAAPGPSSATIPVVVITGETARGMALLGLHLVRGLMGKIT